MCSALINVLLVDALARVSLLLADFIVVVVTRLVTHEHRGESVLRARMSITSVLYKYGANTRLSIYLHTQELIALPGGIHFLCERYL